MTTLHVHVSTESADCDGSYSRTNVLAAEDGQDDYGFRAEIIGNALTYADSNTTAKFDDYGFTITAPTEEGYFYSEFRWCTDDDVDQPSTFRDHRAESMGY